MSSTWHAPAELLNAYHSGALDSVRTMSVDAHLHRCPRCRAALPAERQWVAASWDRLIASIVPPRLSAVERVLRRCGMPEHLARLLAGTPTLSRSWLMAVAVVLGFAVAITHATHGAVLDPVRMLPFLLATPVLPVAGIAVAYGRRVDPAYEMLAATPLAGARLLLGRASAVLVTGVVAAGLATPLLPGPPLYGAAWLLPALTLTVACLVLATRVPVPLAAAVVAAAWLTGVPLVGALAGDRLLAFQPATQLAYAGAAVLLGAVLHRRRRHLDPGEPRWNRRSAFAR